jgi:hypothetical protein
MSVPPWLDNWGVSFVPHKTVHCDKGVTDSSTPDNRPRPSTIQDNLLGFSPGGTSGLDGPAVHWRGGDGGDGGGANFARMMSNSSRCVTRARSHGLSSPLAHNNAVPHTMEITAAALA